MALRPAWQLIRSVYPNTPEHRTPCVRHSYTVRKSDIIIRARSSPHFPRARVLHVIWGVRDLATYVQPSAPMNSILLLAGLLGLALSSWGQRTNESPYVGSNTCEECHKQGY